MIIDRVEKALKMAKEYDDKNASMLVMLLTQLKMVTKSRKTGDTLPDDKAEAIINLMISGLRTNTRLNLGNINIETENNIKIDILRSILDSDDHSWS